jgi:hypothetical protein
MNMPCLSNAKVVGQTTSYENALSYHLPLLLLHSFRLEIRVTSLYIYTVDITQLTKVVGQLLSLRPLSLLAWKGFGSTCSRLRGLAGSGFSFYGHTLTASTHMCTCVGQGSIPQARKTRYASTYDRCLETLNVCNSRNYETWHISIVTGRRNLPTCRGC